MQATETQTAGSLKERAIAAREELDRETAARQAAQEAARMEREKKEKAERAEKLAALIEKNLGVHVEPTGDDVLTVDGLRFTLGFNYGTPVINLLRPCTECGGVGAEELIYNLADLGRYLPIKPTTCANCADARWQAEMDRKDAERAALRAKAEANKPEPTALDDLGLALIDYLIDQGFQMSNAEYE